MLQGTIKQGALYSATFVTVATLVFVAVCFFPDGVKGAIISDGECVIPFIQNMPTINGVL